MRIEVRDYLKSAFQGWIGTSGLILITTLLLLWVGVVFVHSATVDTGIGFPGPYAVSQIKKIIVGIGVLLAISTMSPRVLERVTPLFFVGTMTVLSGMVVWKMFFGGVVRWIRWGPLQFQPSELAKISTVMMLAMLLRGGLEQSRWKHVISILACGIAPFILIAAQPDLGTAMVLVPTVVAMIWVAQLGKRRLLLLFTAAIFLSGPLGYMLLKPYQIDRVYSFLGIGAVAAEDAGNHQVTQSIIALGSGGPTGKGLHQGSHHDLGYLFADHNDFIFAVIGEEWGLQGTVLVILGFLLLILSMLGVGWSSRDHFSRLLSVGIATQIFTQAAFNMAVTVGLLPVTGLPLPFVSYGGTSIVVSLMGVGLVIAVARNPIDENQLDGIRNRPSHL
ncbi:MAG: FtsW/RodA/SpoVE family cell cycle protein [Planctomycetia bacterium]|nr:FtsW/RodA/SpoVE family cell cycle protein [Planctomycetia bacterium]